MGQKEDFTAIILAAGKGTRMKSPLPKVLHPVAGLPMISRVIDAVDKAGAKEIRVVVGHGEDLVKQVIEPLGAVSFRQIQQRGTADAVSAAQPESVDGPILILNGDHPLLEEKDIKNIIREFVNSNSSVSVVTAKLKRPASFGRIVRHHDQLKAIVEAKDASSETLKINEINTGIYVIKPEVIKKYLPQIESHNAQGEFYFTDIVALCSENNEPISTIVCGAHVAFGVNSQQELSRATQLIFRRKTNQLLDEGVVIIDPKTTYIEDDVEVGEATVIYPGNYIRNGSTIGKFCVIEPNCYLAKVKVSNSVQIRSGSYIEDTVIKARAIIGPYARLRPKTTIGEEAQVGNFVEMKKVNFGQRAKAGHLTYLGDAEIGENTNIGCGTITCNYAVDRKKYVTKIGKDSFIGSDSQFIAPVNIGDNVVIGSGSTITKDVPNGALAVTRSKQYIKENYKPKETAENKDVETVDKSKNL